MSSPDVIGAAPNLPLVLASASAVRTRLLTNAGVIHLVDPADIDEASVRDSLLADGAAHCSIAETLAEMKAQKTSDRHAGAMVLGADQVLSCAGELFEKPADLDHVRSHLEILRGQTHSLHTSACMVRDGSVIWHENRESVLDIRMLSDEFIENYVATVGTKACQSVGAYLLEGLGVQLFSRIDGDFFDILGLPMLPLLEFLRNNAMLKT